ncbi:hypothetical protein STEG23_018066, partial [Scotinomys teguina]
MIYLHHIYAFCLKKPEKNPRANMFYNTLAMESTQMSINWCNNKEKPVEYISIPKTLEHGNKGLSEKFLSRSVKNCENFHGNCIASIDCF